MYPAFVYVFLHIQCFSFSLFSRSAERSEFLIESEARSAKYLRCRAKLRISVRVYNILMCARNWTRLRNHSARAASCLIFSVSPLLTRDFKYETFRDQWIPLNSVSEVSMREQGQRRLQARKECPRTGLIHNCKRVCRNISKKYFFHWFNCSLLFLSRVRPHTIQGTLTKPCCP